MKTYFKHSIIFSGDQEEVEKEINVYSQDEYTEIVSVNVTPERVGTIELDGFKLPKYIYHVCIVMKDKG